ncbi:hypothetical protein [Qipengyuania flava]|uniref:hypothetical protein n=1 Tax=Qipengyuania flava TaxID=192812 RepID=UPI001C637FF8|nr:hypothetical protein [Qipengyuania flava]QYJ08277.1 hypothetical protein KUV82_06160 [Qipengyuania flava]
MLKFLIAGPLLAAAATTPLLAEETSEPATEATPELRVIAPHPLEGCEKKRRKLTCRPMQSHSGFIFTTNLRNSGRTLQYQISAMSRLLENAEFTADYEPRVRDHLERSLPMIAALIGWEPGSPESEALLARARQALADTEISATMKLRQEGQDYLEFLAEGKRAFEGGAIYATRDRIMNSYSVYIDKPGYEHKR